MHLKTNKTAQMLFSKIISIYCSYLSSSQYTELIYQCTNAVFKGGKKETQQLEKQRVWSHPVDEHKPCTQITYHPLVVFNEKKNGTELLFT